jgi:hypothetical protein
MGKGTICFAIASPEGHWRTKFGKRPSRHTTRLDEVLTVG